MIEKAAGKMYARCQNHTLVGRRMRLRGTRKERYDMNHRENYLRNARMQGPEWIPSTIVISGASWNEHKRDMEEVVLRHPQIFRSYRPGYINFDDIVFPPAYREREVFTDAWGCEWHTSIGGLEGVVVGHPLLNWENFETFNAPDPSVQWDREPANWDKAQAEVNASRNLGELTSGGTPHGFLFDRLTYLRGFENMMLDMALEPPQLNQLIEMLYQHNLTLVKKWLSLDVDVIEFADDLGMQTSSIISPKMVHKWLTPTYSKLIEPCHEAGKLAAFHSDGFILNLVDDFLSAKVDIINPQDLVNGIDNLACEVKGKMCIRLDIDRQKIVPFGTRAEIRALIEEEVRKLGDPSGGLEFIAGIYPPTTPDRVDALACALEEFQTYWWR
jgi:uroporphyrinogen decarboxylase